MVEDFTKIPDDEPLIPNWRCDDHLVKTLRLPFCHNNEISSKKFIDTLEQYINHKFKFIVIWETRNIRSLFPLKDRVNHKSCVIYHGICTSGIAYTGETDRLATTRWKEHDNPIKPSEPSKHLSSYPDHKFTWNIISSAPHSTIKRKILEAYYIAKYKPNLMNKLVLGYSSSLDMELLEQKLIETTFAFERLQTS